jgi:glycine C-acetyltransferase
MTVSAATASNFENTLEEIRSAGLMKLERVIDSPQSALIKVKNGDEVINFCANNYLGLANNKRLINAAKIAMDNYGLGLSSVRFICGTQSIHKELEKQLASFYNTEDVILYCSCFDANGGLFEVVCGEEDAIVSDALNHASIIDGIRLAKAKRYRYVHADMNSLREELKKARTDGAKKILIASDSVFSMDGDVAPLKEICNLADEFQAMVMVDECHATGFFGQTGRGAAEYCGVADRIDITTSTLGKALGGSCGGFTASKQHIVDLLRQRSRPYLFSNSLPPAIVGASLECLKLIQEREGDELREKIRTNTAHFRKEITAMGFKVKGEVHPITPIMLGDARLASEMANDLLKEGIYVIGFSYPVVPKGEARIRVQISAAHSREQIDHALDAFRRIGKARGVI